jgi:hypothetical protein
MTVGFSGEFRVCPALLFEDWALALWALVALDCEEEHARRQQSVAERVSTIEGREGRGARVIRPPDVQVAFVDSDCCSSSALRAGSA